EAVDLMAMSPRQRFETVAEWDDYQSGYLYGIEEKHRNGDISNNTARRLMGLPEFDAVKIPSHYNTGQIEVANFIADQGLDYNHGNVIKYTVRAGKKNPEKELED